MGAGTEGFTDTTGSVNPIGTILSKVLEARKMAEEERQYASDVAERNQTSLEEAGIERGYFFKKALQYKFGGEFADKKKHELKNFFEKKNTAKAIMLGRSGRRKYDRSERIDMIWSLFEDGPKAPTFRDKFKDLYKTSIDDPYLRPQSPIIPGSTKKIQKLNSSNKKRISKEELFQTLTRLLSSLEATANALNGNVASSSGAIIKAANAQENIADQLKHRGTVLEDKLDDLIRAISSQTELKKKEKQIKKVSSAEKTLENIKDASSTEAFDNLMTPENESVAATSSQRIEEQQQLAYQQSNIPQAETGGIISGPDSGYNVRMHGREMIVPLDNAFTNPNKTAVTEQGRKLEKSGASPKVSMMPKKSFEVGTPTQPPSMGGKLGFNITNKLATGGTTQSSMMSQTLVDAMSLPMIATGGTILATTTQLMRSIGDSEMAPNINRIARPIADVFGLPSSITQKATAGKKSEREKAEQDSEEMGSKNILAKLTEGFGKLLESMGKQIEENRPDPSVTPGANLIPGDAPPEIKALMETISGGEGGPNSVQGIGEVPGLSDMTIDQAIAKAKSYIGKGSETGALGAYQQHSDYLRERAIKAGLDPTKDKFSMENQTQIQRVFMVGLYGQTEETLVRHLKEGKLESHVFPKLSRDAGWPSLPGGSQPNVHTAGSASRYKTNLKKYKQAAASMPEATPTSKQDLGQSITQNFGMKTGEERTFDHPKYGEIKAHKTAVGFKFFGAGINNELNMNVGTPQAESIVDYFIKSNGGRTKIDDTAQALAPPPRKTTTDPYKRDTSSGNGAQVAMLNIGGANSRPTAGTSPQPTATNSRASVPQGRSPLDGIYTNPQEILTG